MEVEIKLSKIAPNRNPFLVVEQFEEALAEHCGSKYAVAVDSCTNALLLSLLCWKDNTALFKPKVGVPKHTYLGVAQSVLNAGCRIEWEDMHWVGWYRLGGTPVWDSAKYFAPGMYEELASSLGMDYQPLVCLSFHIAKELPLGRGGAILTDDVYERDWLRRARFDGRTAGETGSTATKITRPGYHMYMQPPDAARALWLLTAHKEANSYEAYPDISEML